MIISTATARAWCSIIGGFVVRDHSLTLYGRYVYGDYCKGDLYSARLGGWRTRGPR